MGIFNLKRTVICLASTFLAVLVEPSFAQLGEHAHATEEERGYRVTVALGHAHVHEGIEEGNKKWLMMPSWAFNADYVVNKHWSFGLHNDLILEDFAVEEHLNNEEHTVLERSRPLATKIVGTYKPGTHLGVMLGVGDEITKHENLFLSTIGIDYGLHMKGGWELVGELTYDVKWKSYDTWVLGFGVSKFIGSGHHKHKG